MTRAAAWAVRAAGLGGRSRGPGRRPVGLRRVAAPSSVRRASTGSRSPPPAPTRRTSSGHVDQRLVPAGAGHAVDLPPGHADDEAHRRRPTVLPRHRVIDGVVTTTVRWQVRVPAARRDRRCCVGTPSTGTATSGGSASGSSATARRSTARDHAPARQGRTAPRPDSSLTATPRVGDGYAQRRAAARGRAPVHRARPRRRRSPPRSRRTIAAVVTRDLSTLDPLHTVQTVLRPRHRHGRPGGHEGDVDVARAAPGARAAEPRRP